MTDTISNTDLTRHWHPLRRRADQLHNYDGGYLLVDPRKLANLLSSMAGLAHADDGDPHVRLQAVYAAVALADDLGDVHHLYAGEDTVTIPLRIGRQA